MPDRDAYPELGHPDVAGWVLGALDPSEAGRFEEHLRSCGECQAAVAELEPVARVFRKAVPAAGPTAAAEPPADLQARTIDSVEQAAAAGPAARVAVSRRWDAKIPSLAAAVIIAAVLSVTFLVSRPGHAPTFTILLHQPSGGTASGQATAHQTADGWSIQLTVHGLQSLGPDRFYECWYAGPGSRPGQPDLITAGTFTIGHSGSATTQMWSAADPRKFPTMQITAGRASDTRQRGQIVLTGTASH